MTYSSKPAISWETMTVLIALLTLAPIPTQDIVWTPYTLRAGSESAEGELGRLKVPENRETAKGTVELAFVRLKSTSEKPGPPIVYLDGGPGSSAINLARSNEYFTVFQMLRASGDVILLDQRGIGLSKPSLTFLGGGPLGDRFFETKETFLAPFLARIRAGFKYFTDQGVHLPSYNTQESADDVDAIRRALGVPKISILGFSYGTHLGLSVIRRHGANLDRAVLIGTEGPDHTVKMPTEGDRQIERIAALVAKDPAWSSVVPDFRALVARVLKKLESQPVPVEMDVNGKMVKNSVGRFGLSHLLCRDLGDTRDFPWFPLLFHTIDQGDYRFLSRIAQRRYVQYQPGVSMMTIVCDYVSGATAAREAAASKEASTALLGDAMNAFSVDMGKEFGLTLLPNIFRSPIRTDVATLFISGTLDWNTQPHQADEVRKTFSRSEHLVIENAGHEDMLTHPQVADQILGYFRGKSTAGFKLNLTVPPFMPPPATANAKRVQ